MLDLFSGIGGFSLAGHLSGFETVGFSETDPFCSKVLAKHWPSVKNYGDIRELDFYDHVHIMTGGFPCQPFSIAGKQNGLRDKRYLWGEFFRIIRQAKPCFVLAENVSGIVSLALDDILSDLESEGYETGALVLPACAANAPHRRDRIWIIANRPSERCEHCCDTRQRGHIPGDKEWNVAAIQSQWEKFKPESWSVNTAKDWFEINARASRNDDGLSGRMDRLKALGNAIVPQVVYPILRGIYELEKCVKV
jgi:DNA (cytosine-5)-methyltransferase 1